MYRGFFISIITIYFLCLGVSSGVVSKQSNVSPDGMQEWRPVSNAPTLNLDDLTQPQQLLLQIYLDELNFCPGKLDGKMGKFSKEALKAYYEGLGIPELMTLEHALRHACTHKSEPFIQVKVPKVAKRFVTFNLPSRYSQLAKRRKANYRSYGEFMSERYHTSVAFLKEINGRRKINSLRVGAEIKVPNVRPFTIENIASRKFEPVLEAENNFAVVDTKKNIMKVFARYEEDGNSRLVAFFPITPGRKSQIRYGNWKIKNSITFPTWRYDPKVLRGTGRSKDSNTFNVPPGPNNPVGILWNGLTARSVGIHGTNNPDTIGRATSSGCIRMSNWDVVKLPNFLRPGCTVVIR